MPAAGATAVAGPPAGGPAAGAAGRWLRAAGRSFILSGALLRGANETRIAWLFQCCGRCCDECCGISILPLLQHPHLMFNAELLLFQNAGGLPGGAGGAAAHAPATQVQFCLSNQQHGSAVPKGNVVSNCMKRAWRRRRKRCSTYRRQAECAHITGRMHHPLCCFQLQEGSLEEAEEALQHEHLKTTRLVDL